MMWACIDSVSVFAESQEDDRGDCEGVHDVRTHFVRDQHGGHMCLRLTRTGEVEFRVLAAGQGRV